MFDFQDQYQKFEQFNEHCKQATEFWFNAIASSVKQFLNVK